MEIMRNKMIFFLSHLLLLPYYKSIQKCHQFCCWHCQSCQRCFPRDLVYLNTPEHLYMELQLPKDILFLVFSSKEMFFQILVHFRMSEKNWHCTQLHSKRRKNLREKENQNKHSFNRWLPGFEHSYRASSSIHVSLGSPELVTVLVSPRVGGSRQYASDMHGIRWKSFRTSRDLN